MDAGFAYIPVGASTGSQSGWTGPTSTFEVRPSADAATALVALREQVEVANVSGALPDALVAELRLWADENHGPDGGVALDRLPQPVSAAYPNVNALKYHFGETAASPEIVTSVAANPEAQSATQPDAAGEKNKGKTMAIRTLGHGNDQEAAAARPRLSIAAADKAVPAIATAATYHVSVAGTDAVQETAAIIAVDKDAQIKSLANTQGEVAAQQVDLVARRFAGDRERYSLTAAEGGLFVSGTKPKGAIDARVQEVRPGSPANFQERHRRAS